MSKIIIKEARAKDWMEFRKIRLEALKENPSSFGTSYEEEVGRSEEQWKERLNDKKRITLIAFDNDRPVGTIGAKLETPLKISHIANITFVYVTPQYRGKSISTKLMEFVLKRIKEKGKIKKVSLHVVKEMAPAIKLYKNFGFQIVGELKNEIKVGKKYYDSLVMELFLK